MTPTCPTFTGNKKFCSVCGYTLPLHRRRDPESVRASWRVIDGNPHHEVSAREFSFVRVTFRDGSSCFLTAPQYLDGDGAFTWTPELRDDVLRTEILGGAW
jgi:hypothetical protein